MTSQDDPKTGTRLFTLTNVFAQTSLVLAVPFVTRFLGAEEFGRYQVVLALSTIFQAIFTGGIEYLIPAVPQQELRRTLHRAILVCSVATALAAACALLFLFIDRGTGVILSASISVAAVYAIAALDTAWRGRSGMLRYLARRNTIFGVGVVMLQVVACLYWPTVWGLVTAVVVSRAASVALTQKRPKVDAVAHSSDASRTASIGLSQNLAWVVGIALSNVALQLPVLIIGTRSLELAGQVGLAIRLVGLPSAIIGAAVGQTFSFRIGKLLREGVSRMRARSLVRQTQLRWSGVGGGLALLSIVVAPFVVTPLLGSGWQPVALYIVILAVPFGLQMATRIVTPGYAALQRSWVLVGLQVVRIIVVALSLLVPFWIHSATTGAIIALAIASGLYFVAFGVVTERVIIKSWPDFPGSSLTAADGASGIAGRRTGNASGDRSLA